MTGLPIRVVVESTNRTTSAVANTEVTTALVFGVAGRRIRVWWVALIGDPQNTAPVEGRLLDSVADVDGTGIGGGPAPSSGFLAFPGGWALTTGADLQLTHWSSAASQKFRVAVGYTYDPVG